MRITILALGSRGDVQPCVALGRGLKAAGHDVRLASFADSEAFVREHGLTYRRIEGNLRELVDTHGQTLHEADRNPVKTFQEVSRHFKILTATEGYWDSFLRACEDAEAILWLYNTPHGFHLAEKLGVPSFVVSPLPFLGRTRHFPCPYLPAGPPLGAYNRMTHRIFEQFMWQPFRGGFNQWRRERLGLPPVPFTGPYAKMQRLPMLYGYSPSVFPKPPDWGAHIHVTGFWFLDRPHDWQPPDDLLDFLQAGPPPVYVGFGSTLMRDPEEMTSLVLSALSRAGQRGILATGWGGLSNRDLPDTVFKVDTIPFDWLFPRLAAAVHHGGAGTTAASLRAGIPTVTIPFFWDQPFWGRRVAALGVGPPPIPRQELSDERLAAAITAATCDPAVRQRAQALGRQIQQEHGVKNAVEAFHRHVG